MSSGNKSSSVAKLSLAFLYLFSGLEMLGLSFELTSEGLVVDLLANSVLKREPTTLILVSRS